MKTSPWFLLLAAALYSFGVLTLMVNLFRLQILKEAEIGEAQTSQSVRTVILPGSRGRILDRNGRVLAESRPSRCIQCRVDAFRCRGPVSNMVNAVDAACDRLSAFLGRPRTLSRPMIERHLRQSSVLRLTVLRNLSARELARFAENENDFPGFESFVQPERFYPYGSLAAHVLGYVGSARAGNDGFSLVTGDSSVRFGEPESVGRAGVEGYYNDFLKGVNGRKNVLVDARGLPPKQTSLNASLIKDAEQPVDPTNGLDLRLTLDIAVQHTLERELRGCTGAGVVLDPRTGAILAMASAPTFDPNSCVPALSKEVFFSLTNAPAKCGQNRAISESYAPGSTFKPITALAALDKGWNPAEEHDCLGVFVLGKWRLRCWDLYGHGLINLRRSIEQSCNSFFCHLGRTYGPDAIGAAARAFGLGSPTGVDLAGETAGVVPDAEWKRLAYNEPWYPGDTCQMSIGQGMLLATPLQMAVVAAALGNGGYVRRPFLFSGNAPSPDSARRLPFPEKDLKLVRQGMFDVAAQGTGRRVQIRWDDESGGVSRTRRYRLKVPAAAKTGTAEIGRGATRRKNTWVIAFAPYVENPTPANQPSVAVAIIVERGESGGKTVAPKIHSVLAQIFGEEEIVGKRRARN